MITDKNRAVWQVNEDGTSEELGKAAEGGVLTAKNTKGMGKNGKVQALTSKDIKITFTPSGYYSSDTLDESIRSEKFISEYEHLTNTEGVSVPVLYKALSDAPHATDTLEAEASFSNGKTTEDIIFKTKEGSSVPVTWNGNTAALTLTKRFDFAKQEIIATVKPSDTTGSYEIAGTVNVWHLAQQQVNVTVVPINKDIALSSEEIETQLNNIYLPAGVRFKVRKEAPFSIPISAWDIIDEGNEKLDIGDSRTLANYTVEQRAVWQYYGSQKTVATDQYYLFVWNDSTTDPNTKGFMPLKRQHGFIYGNDADTHTMAHELGHGVFGLKHPFSEYDDFPEGTTDLLMDYGEGTQLSHMDWKTMHAPGLQLYLFQKDEEGEFKIYIHKRIIKKALLNSGIKNRLSKNFYTSLTLGNTYTADILGAFSDYHFDGRKDFIEVYDEWINLELSINNKLNEIGSLNRLYGGYDVEKLGIMLHTVQDFYSHSNFVELYVEFYSKKNNGIIPSEVPIFQDALALDELLIIFKRTSFDKEGKYMGLRTGDFDFTENEFWDVNPFEEKGTGVNTHAQINKDKANSMMGRLAEDVAYRHTLKILKSLNSKF